MTVTPVPLNVVKLGDYLKVPDERWLKITYFNAYSRTGQATDTLRKRRYWIEVDQHNTIWVELCPTAVKYTEFEYQLQRLQ